MLIPAHLHSLALATVGLKAHFVELRQTTARQILATPMQHVLITASTLFSATVRLGTRAGHALRKSMTAPVIHAGI